MIGLITGNLRVYSHVWLGAFWVAVVCGFVVSCGMFLHYTAGFYDEWTRKTLQNAGSSVIVFSSVAGIGVLASIAALTVSLQRREYALWQIAGVSPRAIMVALIGQLVLVSLSGSALGAAGAAFFCDALFPAVFAAWPQMNDVSPQWTIGSLVGACLVVVAIFVCGGLRSCVRAGRVSVMEALRGDEAPSTRVFWLRALLTVSLVALLAWAAVGLSESDFTTVMTWGVLLPIPFCALIGLSASFVCPFVTRVWTAVVPPSMVPAWIVARRRALAELAHGSSAQLPVAVGFGMVAGLYSVLGALRSYAAMQGADASGYGLGLTEVILMLGGPVLVCGVGAACSVVMSVKSRGRDVSLLSAAGASQAMVVASASLEAVIHVVSSILLGSAVALLSVMMLNVSLGASLFAGAELAPGLVVAAVGAILIAFATLVPTGIALSRDVGPALALRE
ncbi:ABC transporter permease [Eggerthellaceae bacterium zg-1084]|uniref:FtsX-like permease family protein n=1 Tax=Berryella wangjianweii TaxID=2734634 RepID=UPI0015539020|nr:FtsX-like permease family protein [Berryella wangjianweii]NPD30429.1 ABC transporter permease [Berryella wangjianweii]